MTQYRPRISIIIVNYNVEYFLEQCLNSVYKALKEVDGEVFVVDNNSIDGSVEMVRQHFPEVKLFANKENLGFSKANNQAIRQSKGDYILLLNPDTVVEEDTFKKCIDFMDKHPDGGGLGVHMIDGKGRFLPESKRGLPTPAVAFYKIFGFSKLFPKSRIFGKYHLGYLKEYEINKIDILSGAFMFMRKEALDKVGLLDENFFMYGEDIDLSYRITQGGYKNYYYPDTQIIHYKGESTKKGSINYVFIFYRAMIIFAEKHFSQKNARLYSLLINLAIYLRAGLAILYRFVKRISLPLADFIVILLGLFAASQLWILKDINFDFDLLKYALPGYTTIWLVSVLYSGGYDSPIKLKSYLKGSLIGMIILLVIYALLPSGLRFSRLFIILGTAITLAYYTVSRTLLHFFFRKQFNLRDVKNKNYIIIGTEEEIQRVKSIIKNTPHKTKNCYSVSPTNSKRSDDIGTLGQLDQIIPYYKVNEVIFCAKDISADEIIKWMGLTTHYDVEFKIAQPNSLSIIGSNSIDTKGDLYLMDINNISSSSGKRNKRTFDAITAFCCLLSSPISIWLYQRKKKFLKNCWDVLLGMKTWVGYSSTLQLQENYLPKIKEGILTPSESMNKTTDKTLIAKINLIYARDYSILKDLEILRKFWRQLDR